jgi:hypothetical protein
MPRIIQKEAASVGAAARLNDGDDDYYECLTSRRSQPPLVIAVPLSRFTSLVGGGSAFFVRRRQSIYPVNLALPSLEEFVRTAFWTLWTLTITFTVYAYAVYFGFTALSRYTEDAPQFYIDAVLCAAGSQFAALMLLPFVVAIARWSKPLLYLGIGALAFAFSYLFFPVIST